MTADILAKKTSITNARLTRHYSCTSGCQVALLRISVKGETSFQINKIKIKICIRIISDVS